MENKYGFCGRLTKEFPSQVVVDITELCNLACIHCPHSEFVKSPLYQARMLEPELNKKLVDEVREHGGVHCKYIRYTSEGEPLLHPRVYDILDYAVENSGVFVTLTTNGTIMNEERIRKLINSGIHMIDISIDAFLPATYSKIRVGGNLEVTNRNVKNLIQWINEERANTKVIVSFVEQELNTKETSDFEKFWEDNGAEYVVIRRLHSCGGAKDIIASKMNEKIGGEERYPCLYPWERVCLNPRGYLCFCPADWGGHCAVADYRTNDIRDVWSGEFYASLRNAHLSGNFSNHAHCGQCPDWNCTRWSWQGRSYADVVSEIK